MKMTANARTHARGTAASKRAFAFALLLSLLCTLFFSGCGGIDENVNPSGSKAETTTANKQEPVQTEPAAPSTQEETAENTQEETAESTEDPGQQAGHEPGRFAPVSLSKIGSFSQAEYRADEYLENVIIVKDNNDRYGLISYDGTVLCAPTYAGIRYTKHLLRFTSNDSDMEAEPDSVNRYGVLREDGTVLIEEGYAILETLGDKYILGIKATAKTTVKENALFYISSSLFTVSPEEGDPLFEGTWHVIDAATGTEVEGATGTTTNFPSDRGSAVVYTDSSNVKHVLLANGKEMPENATLFSNGSYCVTTASEGTVYDGNGMKLFSFDPNAFSVNCDDDHYFAKKTVDGTTSYELLNEKGEICSAPFAYAPSLIGRFALVYDSNFDRYLYDLEGNQILEGAVASAYLDEATQRLMAINMKDKTVGFYDTDGNLILSVTEDETLSVSSYESIMGVCKKDGYDRLYYSVPDEDYTINGTQLGGTFISYVNAGGKDELVDWLTGDVLLQGYDDYDLVGGGENWYVVATDHASKISTVYKIGK